ncbi:MAG: CSLREA domain-containing protein [Ardenticatenaceae bacterium]|nr:CSLREA domain-containing protein [Ardenticatenaceae bacterium]
MKKQMQILGVLCLSGIFVLGAMWFLRGTAVSAAPNATLIVNTLVDENDGSCTDGDCSLRDALALAATGDVIQFSVAGTINIASLGQLTLNTNQLTIEGNQQITINAFNSSRIFNVVATDITLDGLTIMNGTPSGTDCGAFTLSCGGGIMLQTNGAALSVTNSILQNNSATRGGGIYNFEGTVTIINSEFLDNSTSSGGGAIYTRAPGELTVSNTVFTGNAASDGGAVFKDGGAVTIASSVFSGNSASLSGGAILSQNSGLLTLENSQILSNTALYGGGINHVNSISIVNSTFAYNTAQEGGGLFLSSGTHTVVNTTVSNNTATDLSGGLASYGNLTLQNSTIVQNQAANGGAGLVGLGVSYVTTMLNHNLIVGNVLSGTTTASDVDLDNGTVDSFVSNGYNILGAVDANVVAFNQMGDQTAVSQANLGPLQDNGGLTWTHTLPMDSLAVNAGGANCAATDQRGVTRPQGVACDVGAYELDQFSLTLSLAGTGAGHVTSSPAGIDCGTNCTFTFAADTAVTLTASPENGSFFAGWGGVCSGQGSCVVSLDQLQNVTATFDELYLIYLPAVERP